MDSINKLSFEQTSIEHKASNWAVDRIHSVERFTMLDFFKTSRYAVTVFDSLTHSEYKCLVKGQDEDNVKANALSLLYSYTGNSIDAFTVKLCEAYDTRSTLELRCSGESKQAVDYILEKGIILTRNDKDALNLGILTKSYHCEDVEVYDAEEGSWLEAKVLAFIVLDIPEAFRHYI